MGDQQPVAKTHTRGVLSLMSSLLWKSKWLIGSATVVAAVVAFAIAQVGAVQMWSGRTTLTIGLVPSVNYLLFAGSPSLEPIESQRALVSRISDPGFRTEVLNRAAFEPASAARSRSSVGASLRGVVLGGDRDVAIELSAASSADVEAGLRALDAEIGKVHGEVLAERMKLLDRLIEQDRHRVAEIEQSSDQLLDRIFKDFQDKSQLSIFSAIPAWGDLQDRIQRNAILKELVERSVVHLKSGGFVQGPRSVATLRTALLAGLAMLVAMIILTVVLDMRARGSIR
jgi:hypothetical protein